MHHREKIELRNKLVVDLTRYQDALANLLDVSEADAAQRAMAYEISRGLALVTRALLDVSDSIDRAMAEEEAEAERQVRNPARGR